MKFYDRLLMEREFLRKQAIKNVTLDISVDNININDIKMTKKERQNSNVITAMLYLLEHTEQEIVAHEIKSFICGNNSDYIEEICESIDYFFGEW